MYEIRASHTTGDTVSNTVNGEKASGNVSISSQSEDGAATVTVTNKVTETPVTPETPADSGTTTTASASVFTGVTGGVNVWIIIGIAAAACAAAAYVIIRKRHGSAE